MADDVYDVKTFAPKRNVKGKDELIIEGVPAKNILRDWRLKHHSVMFLRSKFVRHPNEHKEHLKALREKDTTWLNARMFEEFCNFDPELEKLAKTGDAEKVQARIEWIFLNNYMGTVIEKFKKILPDLANYFAAKAAYGGLFEKDRKWMKTHGEGKEVEDTEVCHLADCWTVRGEQRGDNQ